MMHSKKLLSISCITLIVGAALFGLYNNLFIIQWIGVQRIVQNDRESDINLIKKQRSIPIYFYSKNTLQEEQRTILWTNSPLANIHTVIIAWLTIMQEENLIHKKIDLQSCTMGTHQELFLSLDHSPFHKQQSSYEKMLCIESLLATLHSHEFPIKELYFLVHHQPLQDMHLDFSQGWPLDGFMHIPNQAITPNKYNVRTPFTLILDPFGDASYTGRIIEDSFERGLTLQYVYALKEELEKLCPQTRIVLTRVPGERLEPLQNAAFSNRLQADLYCCISFYHAHNKLPLCWVFYPLLNETQLWAKETLALSFVPYYQAHTSHVSHSAFYAHFFHKQLQKNMHTQWQTETVLGFPYKPLLGILAPAIALECGLEHADSWRALVSPVAQSLTALIGSLQKNFALP